MNSLRKPSIVIRLGSWFLLSAFAFCLLLAAVCLKNHRKDKLQQEYEQGFVAIQAIVTQEEPRPVKDGFQVYTAYSFTPAQGNKAYSGKDRFDSKVYATELEIKERLANPPKSVQVYFHPEEPTDSSRLPPPSNTPISNNILLWAAGVLACFAGAVAAARVAWDRFWKSRDIDGANLAAFVFGLLLLSFSSLLGLVSSLMGINGLSTIIKGFSLGQWQSTTATVLSTSIETSYPDPKKRIPRYNPTVQYSYTVNGKTHRSSAIEVSAYKDLYKSQEEVQSFLKAYSKDSQVKVYYDPEVPQDSALILKSRGGWIPIVVALPMGFFALALLAAAFAILRRGLKFTPRNEVSGHF